MIDRIFPSCPSFLVECNLMYWIILSRMGFRLLSVRRVQFHSLQINNEKRARVRRFTLTGCRLCAELDAWLRSLISGRRRSKAGQPQADPAAERGSARDHHRLSGVP